MVTRTNTALETLPSKALVQAEGKEKEKGLWRVWGRVRLEVASMAGSIKGEKRQDGAGSRCGGAMD